MVTPKCETCKYFDRFGYAGLRIAGYENPGLCRRYPPLPIGEEGRPIYPGVGGDSWCGEHEEEIDGNAGDEEKAAEAQ